MKTEFEVRKLNISVDEMIKTMRSIGANFNGAFYQKRYVYDFTPIEKGRWIRLRSNGEKTTLAVKNITNNEEISGTREVEVVVSDFERTNIILSELGFLPRSYQENFRIEYTLNDIVFDIDKWPMISPFLEIESNSEEKIMDTLNVLKIRTEDTTTIDVDALYNDIYSIDLDLIERLQFTCKEHEEIKQYQDLIV